MTRIADLLEKGQTYSFEFFPPKTDAEQATLVTTLRELEPLGLTAGQRAWYGLGGFFSLTRTIARGIVRPLAVLAQNESSDYTGENASIRWIVDAATSRKGVTMRDALAAEIIDAYNNTGTVVKKKEDTHKMAQANRAFAHLRW